MLKKKTDVIGIIGLLLAIFTLLFGDNIYGQITGKSVFVDEQGLVDAVAPTIHLTTQPDTLLQPVEISSTATEIHVPETVPIVFNPHPDSSDVIDAMGVPMREVPLGEFVMGSEEIVWFTACKEFSYFPENCKLDGLHDEDPPHQVYLETYFIDKYEVTNALYKECVNANACISPEGDSGGSFDEWYYDDSKKNYPVLFVNWNMARTYCEWRGARLPTEAEWEKAARGTDARTYPWGEDDPDCNHTNANDCTEEPMTVGSYKSGISPYGLYDMAGNVWEWVFDWYDVYPGGNQLASERFGKTYQVIRGGSWYDHFTYTSLRTSELPSEISYRLGFRCAKDANP